ncbi:alpha/beta fold hydrolase [Nocardioides sp. dk4132]|uniref:alpha/beta hydrolase family protein n=1 Tax=unclassified Nocardioides TaxID=2615069 RepID=UPI001295365A|nr:MULTISPECIES: dienelactone hydrolase family protein [unclassified Nocardioides]MQW76788.1 alpha/beta fold hydrolase [Nocardioides sp. dk4132]QGA06860.1 alpha/beta fold hydrolase [Nocardioides sp. dk884]
MSSPVLVRAVREAVRVPGAPAPYDTAHVTIRHPARPASTEVERMSGMLPADASGAPYPVVVVVPGVNVSSEGYRWLAVALVEAGYVCVTYDWVGELFAGQNGLTPGVDLTAVGPDTYGTKPTTPALAAVLDRLAELNRVEGVLGGLLDLGRVALFGHSAGGTVALQSASPGWFPGVRAVITYASHTMASQQLGHPAGTLLTAPVAVPVLLVGGSADGVVAASAVRYGEEAGAPGHDPLERTWREALPGAAEAWLAVLSGAGHMLPATPADPSSARGFLEEPLDADQDELREVFARLLTDFLDAKLCDDPAATATLQHHLDQPNPVFADLRRR